MSVRAEEARLVEAGLADARLAEPRPAGPAYANGGGPPEAPRRPERVAPGARERLVRALADLDDLRPAAEKRAALGVGERLWRKWAAEPAFRAEVREETARALELETPEAWRRLVAKVHEGDLRAVDLFFKLTADRDAAAEPPWMEIVRRCFVERAAP